MKYLLIVSFLFVFIACKKEENKNTPTNSLVYSTEAALVGDWIWDSLTWVNSSGTFITNYPSHYGIVGAHMILNSARFDPAIDSLFKGTFYSGSTVNGWWAVVPQGSGERLENNYPSVGTPAIPFQDGIITTLTSTSLVIDHGTINYVKLYYHK